MSIFNKKEEYVPIEGLVGDAPDYNIYKVTIKEKILWFIIGFIVSGAVLYLFYEKWPITIIVGLICGIVFISMRKKQVIEKRKRILSQQFRSLLDALSTSIGAGKNMYDAFAGAVTDLEVQYTSEADIVKEVKFICIGLDNNIQIENLLLNFADRSGLEDIKNFANVFATCYKKGGNIKDVIKNTATILGDKIEIKMELETMVSGQKNEQNIMLVMPIVFIIAMKTMGGDLVDLNSAMGMISSTIALAIFALAYFISTKILDIKL